MEDKKSYKKPYSHEFSIKVMNSSFKKYFEQDVFERFIKFEADFEKIFNEFEV